MNSLEISRFPELGYSANEALNTLCTNLSYCGEGIRSILFTSRYAQEGKSSITMNVMRTMAGLGKRVVVVDSDLRCSMIARRYRFHYHSEHAPGLAQYLAGMCGLDDVLYETNLPNCCVIPAGRELINSLQLLASPRYGEMMEQLRASFDLILVDTPPAGVIVDSVEIAKHCDGAVIVVAYNSGRKQEIGEIAAALSRTGCDVLGMVMNGVEMETLQNRKYYYRSQHYSHYYKYARGYGKDQNDKK